MDDRRRPRPMACGSSLGLLLGLLLLAMAAAQQTDSGDMAVLQALLKNIEDPTPLRWVGNDACGSKWSHIRCTGSSVSELQLQNLGLRGQLPSNLNQLQNLETISLQGNSFSGALPTFNGLSNLQTAYLAGNQFDSIPADFFKGLTNLQLISLDDNPLNASVGWTLPSDVAASTSLAYLSLSNTSLTGAIPSFLGSLPSLQNLRMSYNKLSGGIPSSFNGANIVSLQLNNQVGSTPLFGPIDVVATMQSLRELWLQVNTFSGTIPAGLGSLVSLQDCRLNDNALVGPIPSTFSKSSSLIYLSVKNNMLDGPLPRIASITSRANYSFSGNEFCVEQIGVACASQVNALLSFLAGVGYPIDLVKSWSNNNPCASWSGISCDRTGSNVIAINLPSSGLNGYISPDLASLSFLSVLILRNNNLTGTIPTSLTTLKFLQQIDVSNNNLYGPVPVFTQVKVIDAGNPNINKAQPPSPPPSTTPTSFSPADSRGAGSGPGENSAPPSGPSGVTDTGKPSSTSVKAIAGAVLGVVGFLLLGAIVAFAQFKKKQQKLSKVQSPNMALMRPSREGSDPDTLKLSVNCNAGHGNPIETPSHWSKGPSDAQVVEPGDLVVSIEMLRAVTNNFSEENVLGRGGFGVVYEGELDDGTKVAVKRMEASVVSNKGLSEFQAEIAVLTKVRHRHLVALLGYCIDGNERLLVYEHMPLGTLSQHLFEWAKYGLPPLNWKKRTSIALDVARGMEYLHGLAHKSFIHRDLKPSNILLGGDYRAKVSDFGLVKLAPEGTFCSVETRLAGTFGYLAPEYAVTGRVTTKADVFSFGVVLMELITGRKALDDSQPEESMHLVTWFRRVSANKQAFLKAIDRVLEVTDETFGSMCTVAELARHCTGREPHQRPDMSHAVNVLCSLVEQWKPTDILEEEEGEGLDVGMTLPQALKRWQAVEEEGSFTEGETSRSTWPKGFTRTFTSADGR